MPAMPVPMMTVSHVRSPFNDGASGATVVSIQRERVRRSKSEFIGCPNVRMASGNVSPDGQFLTEFARPLTAVPAQSVEGVKSPRPHLAPVLTGIVHIGWTIARCPTNE